MPEVYQPRERLSANTLFNFSSRPAYFYGKLESGFIPRFNMEDLSMFASKQDMTFKNAFPMTCFCDIPIAQLKDHTGKYGKYGIGLTKEWGIKNGLNPVLYISSNNSQIISQLKGALITLKSVEENGGKDIKEKIHSIQNNLYHVLRYFKPYQGIQDTKPLTFYDEKEWRYLPEANHEHDYFYLAEEGFNNEDCKKEANDDMTVKKIEFTCDDIKFLVVPAKSDVQSLVNFLQGHKKYKSACIDLIRRIITIEEIEHDF